MTGDESAFVKAIAGAGGDMTPRLVFADWLQDRGRDAAAAFWRWAAAPPVELAVHWDDSDEVWSWFDGDAYGDPSTGDVPAGVYGSLTYGRASTVGDRRPLWRDYATQFEAYADLAQAADAYTPTPAEAAHVQ